VRRSERDSTFGSAFGSAPTRGWARGVNILDILDAGADSDSVFKPDSRCGFGVNDLVSIGLTIGRVTAGLAAWAPNLLMIGLVTRLTVCGFVCSPDLPSLVFVADAPAPC
jgi:hypothetical protein